MSDDKQPLIQNLLVTGGCGFIGSNLIRFILEDSDFQGRVVNLDTLTYAGNPDNVAGLAETFPDRYVFTRTDICDPEAVHKVFEDYNIDAVCHLAAESHVDRSIYAPDTFIKTNVMGTFNLLEASRRIQDRLIRFHHVSTDEVFGSLGDTGFFTETTRYKPNSPYSASKASSDMFVRAYNKTYGLPVTMSNCSNNYGPYHFPEKLIPLMILNALAGKPLPVYGDGKHVRDWLYVRDHCTGIYAVLTKGRDGETYNIGGRNEMENLSVVEILADTLDELVGELSSGPRRNLIEFVKDRPGHDRRYAIDCSKICDELYWAPEESFETGLRKTIQWYLDNSEWVERIQSGSYKEWMEKHYQETS